MRRIIQIAVGAAMAVSMSALADSFPMVVTGVSSGATVVVTNKQPVTGFVNSLNITATSGTITGTVTVAGRDETLVIVATTAAGAMGTYHPLVYNCWTNGTAFVTNLTRFYLSDECPVVSVTGGTIKPTASGDVRVVFKLSPN